MNIYSLPSNTTKLSTTPTRSSALVSLHSKFRIVFILVAAGLCVSLGGIASAGPLPLPQLGVYRGNALQGAPNKVTEYGTWLNRPDMWGEDFLGQDVWDNIRYPGWLTSPWSNWIKARPGRKLLLSVPMLPKSPADVSLAKGATGAYNVYFRSLGQDLVSKGIADSVIIRLGWEFNGGWYKWAAKNDQPSFVLYWRQIVETMRAVPGASNLKFCFNPIAGYQQFPAQNVYPGDVYVDYIALDCYDESWAPNTYPWPEGTSAADILARRATVWKDVIKGGSHGLDYWRAFAAQRGKGFGIAEWGVNARPDNHGGLDNDYYITQMHNYLTTYPVVFAVYFDVQAPDGHHQLSPPSTEFPNSAATFFSLFGDVKQDIIIDNSNPSGITLLGSWTKSTFTAGFYGSDYLHDGNSDGKSITFSADIPAAHAGTYKVYARWVSAPNYNPWVPVTTTHEGGDSTVYVNQTWGGGTWRLLGTYTFSGGSVARVKIGNPGSGYVIADAVRFTEQ